MTGDQERWQEAEGEAGVGGDGSLGRRVQPLKSRRALAPDRACLRSHPRALNRP